MEIIERFYNVFESIHQYYIEINEFIDKVATNYWLDYTIEGILLEKDGKRLLIEMFFNYGVMLLLLDRLIPSIARERIVVCYVRYKSSADSDLTTQVAKMCKSTGAIFDRTNRKLE
jgi:WASH complex subunit strumpellin